MPSPSERVNLAECASHGRPPDFANASPIVKKARGSVPSMWKLGLTVLALLAVAALGYFIWTAFVFPPEAPSS
jgi:hypothetical protein